MCVNVHTPLFFRVTVVSLAYQPASHLSHLMKSHTYRNFLSNCLTKNVSRHQYEALHNDMTHHSCTIRTIISWFLYCLWSTLKLYVWLAATLSFTFIQCYQFPTNQQFMSFKGILSGLFLLLKSYILCCSSPSSHLLFLIYCTSLCLGYLAFFTVYYVYSIFRISSYSVLSENFLDIFSFH